MGTSTKTALLLGVLSIALIASLGMNSYAWDCIGLHLKYGNICDSTPGRTTRCVPLTDACIDPPARAVCPECPSPACMWAKFPDAGTYSSCIQPSPYNLYYVCPMCDQYKCAEGTAFAAKEGRDCVDPRCTYSISYHNVCAI